MKRLTITLAASFAALAVSAGAAFGASPVQSATQSSSTDQAALAASSATQVQPSNENISVRVLSPGNDGAVSQSNDAASSANASNNASTTQNANQSLASACGCSVPEIKAGHVDDVLAGALQAAGTNAAAAPASAPAAAPAAAPAPAPAATTQSNDAASSGTATNTAPTSQTATQSAGGGSGTQSTQQDASTRQAAEAASSATQDHPSNSNISVRILSPGNDGAVNQSNDASSSATASNTAATTQGSSQTGSGSGVQSSKQDAETTQGSAALSSATQDHPSNSNISVRVLSPGTDGSVSQSNKAASSADAKNTAPVTQTSTQSGSGTSCACQSTSPAVQSIGQSSSVGQAAFGASSADQLGASNASDPVRIHSAGGGGSLTQSNEASSEASGTNTAPVSQTGTQTQSGSGCGCSTGPAVQAVGQSSEIGQLAAGLSSATQIGASNTSDPVRIASYGNDGSVSQENEAASSADASNTAPVTQTGTQTQSGSGVQALGQDSSIRQAALAASAANQLPGESRCGCGGSFGNSADPVRIASDGNDGALTQHNGAASSAGATNVATPTQTGTEMQSSACGCHGLGVQALGQWSSVDQLAAALSAAKQIGASNSSRPVRIRSYGGAGPTRLADGTAQSGAAPYAGRILRTGTWSMF